MHTRTKGGGRNLTGMNWERAIQTMLMVIEAMSIMIKEAGVNTMLVGKKTLELRR